MSDLLTKYDRPVVENHRVEQPPAFNLLVQSEQVRNPVAVHIKKDRGLVQPVVHVKALGDGRIGPPLSVERIAVKSQGRVGTTKQAVAPVELHHDGRGILVQPVNVVEAITIEIASLDA